MLNGQAAPGTIYFDAGGTYRLRLIDITPNGGRLFRLTKPDNTPVMWRAIGKDGADLPPHQQTVRPAVLLMLVGETYDFAFTPTEAGPLVLDGGAPGFFVFRAPVVVRPGGRD